MLSLKMEILDELVASEEVREALAQDTGARVGLAAVAREAGFDPALLAGAPSLDPGRCYDVGTMMIRTQIALDSDEHRRAKQRAAEQGVSLAEYLRKLVRRDLRAEELPGADIGAVFGLGDSGGSDIAANKDDYLGDAVEAQYLRKAS
jgi:plasmid stability protein